jgi:hypothetical protein
MPFTYITISFGVLYEIFKESSNSVFLIFQNLRTTAFSSLKRIRIKQALVQVNSSPPLLPKNNTLEKVLWFSQEDYNFLGSLFEEKNFKFFRILEIFQNQLFQF